MDDERLQKIKGGGLLEVIRERPAMYLGQRSLSALSQYLQGYWMALSVHGIQCAFPLPQDFHDWVAYRLHFYEYQRLQEHDLETCPRRIRRSGSLL